MLNYRAILQKNLDRDIIKNNTNIYLAILTSVLKTLFKKPIKKII